jgi:hypothetical protein
MMRMMMEKEMSRAATHISAPFEKCPFFPTSMILIIIQGHTLTMPSSGIFYAALRSHPACSAQIEACYRVSFDRSRQKRGPPPLSRL